MNSKLEEKLIQYEKSTSVTNDAELMHALENIINAEELRPAEERDFDLLDEAIEALLSLQGEDIESLDTHAEKYTEKYMAEFSKKNAQQPVKLILRAFKLKRLIPIVAAISMIFITTIVSHTTSYDWFSDVYNRVKNTFSENERAMAAGDYYEFSTLEDLYDIPECEGMLLPWSLPSGYSYKRISAQKVFVKIADNSFKDYTVIDITTTGENSWQRISIEPSIVAHDSEGVNLLLSGMDVAYYKIDDRHYGVFEIGENTYTVSAISFAELKKILNSMHPSNAELSAEKTEDELYEVPKTQNAIDPEGSVEPSETITGFVVKGQKYDYNGGNVMILDVENNTSKNYTLTVTGVCKDENGEVLKTVNKIYDGFPVGWSNYFVFNPGIEFDSFSFEVTAEEYEGKTFSNYVEFGNDADIRISWLPSDGSGKLIIPTSPEEHAALSNYVTVSGGVKGVNTYPELIKYKGEVVIFDSKNDIWLIGTPGIQGNISSGNLYLSTWIMTDILWEDREQYELPKNLENVTGLVSVKYVVKYKHPFDTQ